MAVYHIELRLQLAPVQSFSGMFVNTLRLFRDSLYSLHVSCVRIYHRNFYDKWPVWEVELFSSQSLLCILVKKSIKVIIQNLISNKCTYWYFFFVSLKYHKYTKYFHAPPLLIFFKCKNIATKLYRPYGLYWLKFIEYKG